MNCSSTFAKPRVRIPAGFFIRTAGLLGAFLGLAGIPARAEVLLLETFTYLGGSSFLDSQTWKGQDGTIPQIYVINRKLSLRDGESGAVSALLSGQPYESGQLYAGFTVRFTALPTSSGSPFAAFTDASGARQLGRLYATTEGAAAGTVRIGMSTFMNPLNNTVPVDMVPGQDYRVMIRYEPAFLGVTVWVNPETEDSDGVRPQEDFSTFPSPIASILFRQTLDMGNQEEIMTVDGLVVATTFAEAKEAPEEQLWEYTIQNDSVTITRYLGGGPEVVIPETIEGLPVKRFMSGIFQYVRPPLQNLTLPASITSLALGEFSGHYSLTNVTILGRITSIPTAAFNECSNLLTVTYPDSITSIGDGAFHGCSRLAAISLPETLTRIGIEAFGRCASLTEVKIPRNVGTIGSRVFQRCSRLEAIEVDPLNPSFISVEGVLFKSDQTRLIQFPGAKSGSYVVPSTVIGLETGAFAGSVNVTEVTLPDGLKAIPNGTFMGCRSLATVKLPASVISIGSQAFHTSGLVEFAIPEGVAVIQDETFAFCPNLTKVTIPDSVRTIGVMALAGCEKLEKLDISANVATIRPAAFQLCPRLAAINVDEMNTAYTSVDGILYNKSMTTILAYPGGKTGDYQLPDSIRRIEESAFAGAVHLPGLVVPDAVTFMGAGAFQECKQLASIRLGRGITAILQSAFVNCESLTTVILPDTLRSLADLAFGGCPKLRHIIIPASVRTLGLGVFENYYEPGGLESIYFEGNRPTATEQSLVYNAFERGPTVYYGAGTTGWEETFAGRPSVALDPQFPVIVPSFGVRDGKFGLTIAGAAGLVVVVETCADFANPVWTVVGTYPLADGASSYIDPETGTRSARFYRLRVP